MSISSASLIGPFNKQGQVIKRGGLQATGKLKKYLDYIPGFVKIIIAASDSVDLNVRNDNLCTDPNSMAWKGEGNVGGTISLALLNYDKAIGPGEAIKIDTDLPGSTLLFEILSIDAPSMFVVQGGWGNLTVSGKAKIDAIGVVKIKQSFH